MNVDRRLIGGSLFPLPRFGGAVVLWRAGERGRCVVYACSSAVQHKHISLYSMLNITVCEVLESRQKINY